MTKNIRLAARLLAFAGFLGLSALVAPSCSNDDAQGLCGGAECGAGQQCLAGPGGDVCACSTGAQTGCDPGLECQDVAGGTPACFCSVDGQSGCADGNVCETVIGSHSDCFPPVLVRGNVFDLATDAGIEGALVVARDVNNAAVSDLAVTDANGDYELAVPTPRTATGALTENQVTMRADAFGYVTFPTAPRVALPFDTANATGDPLVVNTPAADIGMVALPSTNGLGTLSGHVIAQKPRGTLVVAGGSAGQGGGVTGVAAVDGAYTVFNVPIGSVPVDGYKIGLQLTGVTAQVSAGQETTGVDLVASGAATAVVSGSVQIVNPGNGDQTSVILVVDETFNENAASGQAPPGLRVGDIGGAWSIAGVPDGHYVVLAAFENDFLVRDPDTSIGGTSLVRVTVAGQNVDIAEGFKVTGSLDDVSPDAEEVVSGTPTFVWADDSGEEHYEIQLYDVFGSLVWEDTNVPGVSGSATVSVQYGGPALTSGRLYQFRATSIKNGGTPLSRTEDLKGVFLYQ